MPTFIDESGDTGPTKNGGKPYYRLGAVWVPSLDDAEDFREAVRQLRHDLGLRANYEFKFAKTHARSEERREFFMIALAREFRLTVCSIDKTAAYWNSAGASEQHWACATTLAVYLRSTFYKAEEEKCPLREPIVVDNNSDGEFLNSIKCAFHGLKSRIRPGSSLIGPLTFHKSKSDEMLQLADMICGAVGAFIDGHDKTWYQLLAGRDLGTVCLP